MQSETRKWVQSLAIQKERHPLVDADWGTLGALAEEGRRTDPKRNDEVDCPTCEYCCASFLRSNSAHRQPPLQKEEKTCKNIPYRHLTSLITVIGTTIEHLILTKKWAKNLWQIVNCHFCYVRFDSHEKLTEQLQIICHGQEICRCSSLLWLINLWQVCTIREQNYTLFSGLLKMHLHCMILFQNGKST